MKSVGSKLTKRKTVLMLLVLLFLFGLATKVSAGWVFSGLENSGEARDVAEDNGSLNLEASTQKMVDEYFVSLNCSLGGVGCTNKPDKFHAFYDRSVLGASQKVISLAYAFPPASTSNYLAFMGSKSGLIDKTYAQGIGYSGLQPILGLWNAMKNTSYVVILIVLVFMGILIMFRKSLDPQTVLTFQMAIPRVIITIILITFSYAIAGFVIDLIYLSILFVIQIFESGKLLDVGAIAQAKQDFTSDSPWVIFGYTLKSIPVDAGGLFSGGSGILTGLGLFGPLGITFGVFAFIIGAVISGLFETVSGGGGVGLNIIGNIVSPFVMLIVFVGLISVAFRLIWMLINAYIQLIINIVFAPIMLLGDLFSGGASFWNWFTNLLGFAVVYPVTALLLLTAYVINIQLKDIGGLWVAPMVPGFSSEVIGSIIGIGVLFMIPQIVKSVQEVFKPSSPVSITGGTAVAPLTGAFNMGMNLFQTYRLFRPHQLLSKEAQEGLAHMSDAVKKT